MQYATTSQTDWKKIEPLFLPNFWLNWENNIPFYRFNYVLTLFMRLSSAPGYLLKSMFISLLLIMSVSLTLDTVDINQIMLKFLLF